jgi:flavodoxin
LDPAGQKSGTRRVHRGGGWNDFGKNLRSAYRGAMQQASKSYNVGIRLAMNAKKHAKGTFVTSELATGATQSRDNATAGDVSKSKTLIVFYSWSGNTRGVAREIKKQTSFDMVELKLVKPYSDDYNTVLNEAQRDQHKQARPALKTKIENFGQYDTFIIGYPNWWASIPMPIATLLESYDFKGKKIIPFCSHGGGRFGQSITAIAKLAPNAKIGEGLSVHYSGGSSLKKDIADWLKKNGVK